MDFIQACRKFISIDSSPSHGTKVLGEYAAQLCREHGLVVEVQEEILGDLPQLNVMARWPSVQGQRSESELMLQAHLDTVDPGPFGLWTETGQNPFDAHIVDGKIYGLGSAEVKLDFLCKLQAMSAVPASARAKMAPVLVGTFGEEMGMAGALKLIRKNKVQAKMALVGEPSDLRLLTSAKGFAGVEIRIPYAKEERKYREDHNLRESTSTQSRVFNGKAAHSSVPHMGESAIKKMLDYLVQLPESVVVMEVDGGVNFNTVPSNAFLELDLVSGNFDSMASKISVIYREIQELEAEFLKFRDEEFVPSHPTLNIGIIRTFEDHVFISGNCRIPPVVTNEIYESWMQRLQNICRSVGAEFRVTNYNRPVRIESGSMLVRACRDELTQMGLVADPTTQSSTNEASLFARVGIDCISFGAGKREGNTHTPKEHVLIEDLNKATEFYRRMIQRFCI